MSSRVETFLLHFRWLEQAQNRRSGLLRKSERERNLAVFGSCNFGHRRSGQHEHKPASPSLGACLQNKWEDRRDARCSISVVSRNQKGAHITKTSNENRCCKTVSAIQNASPDFIHLDFAMLPTFDHASATLPYLWWQGHLQHQPRKITPAPNRCQ